MLCDLLLKTGHLKKQAYPLLFADGSMLLFADGSMHGKTYTMSLAGSLKVSLGFFRVWVFSGSVGVLVSNFPVYMAVLKCIKENKRLLLLQVKILKRKTFWTDWYTVIYGLGSSSLLQFITSLYYRRQPGSLWQKDTDKTMI